MKPLGHGAKPLSAWVFLATCWLPAGALAAQSEAPAAPATEAGEGAAQVTPAEATPAAAEPSPAAQTPSPAEPIVAPASIRLDPAARPAAKPEAPRSSPYDGPPTLVGARKPKLGAYGGFGAAYTRMLARDGALLSFEAALLINHRLSLGLAGYGFSRTPRGPAELDGTPRRFGAGYGGFAARYSVFSNFPVYGTFGVLIGGGAVALDDDIGDDGWDDESWRDDDSSDFQRESFDGFFVVQPEVAVQSNVTRWFRIGLTGGYRFTSGVGRFGLEDADTNGFLVGGNLQLGWF